MVRITMMRGAQSGGVITYVKDGKHGVRGIRSRVVNGKRTDLSELTVAKLKSDQSMAPLIDGPRIYAGHTRFATTSKATFDGTHPHQWTPPEVMNVWRRDDKGTWTCKMENVENFICHNGDLDAFAIGGVTHPLEALMPWLVTANHSPCPSPVDSCGVAGTVDLLRCQGVWYKAIKFGFIFGLERPNLDFRMPSKQEFQAAAKVCEQVFTNCVKETTKSNAMTVEQVQSLMDADTNKDGSIDEEELRAHLKKLNKGWTEQQVADFCSGIMKKFDQNKNKSLAKEELYAYDPLLRRAVVSELMKKWEKTGVLGVKGDLEGGVLLNMVEKTVEGFFDQDLFQTVRMFLNNAKGSFGLMMNSSLDVGRQLCVAARGQTISVAMYPESGLVLWGSEQAACKAAINFLGEKAAQGAVRIDLDDLGGEVCLIDWGTGEPSIVPATHELKPHKVMHNKVSLTLAQEQLASKLFENRLVEMTGNDLVLALPPAVKDAVGADINDIPRALQAITESMEGENAMPTYCLGKELMRRIRLYDEGKHDGTVDVLLTGCEVSLWLAEQFASDLHLLLPKLNIKVLSSNKLLGLLGQDFASPQVGHQFHETSWKLEDTIALVVSHSGGTFGPLAVSNLLMGYTKNLFVITSEWDTQIGKQLRQLSVPNSWEFKASIFSTSIVAATHHLLTEILLYVMKRVQKEGLEDAAGGTYSFEDTHILEDTHAKNIQAMEEIIGVTVEGKAKPTATSKHLRGLGAYWSQHVLEGVYSWILVFTYIMVTVIWGKPLVSGIATTIDKTISRDFCAMKTPNCETKVIIAYVLGVLDAIIYVFSPQIGRAHV